MIPKRPITSCLKKRIDFRRFFSLAKYPGGYTRIMLLVPAPGLLGLTSGHFFVGLARQAMTESNMGYHLRRFGCKRACRISGTNSLSSAHRWILELIQPASFLLRTQSVGLPEFSGQHAWTRDISGSGCGALCPRRSWK